MYQAVARQPHEGHFHFEMGRGLMERLGYPHVDLDAVPAAALESFAGVGYFFDFAALTSGETVADLGSGSGSDAFIGARHVGRSGRVIGIDMTDAQLEKAMALARAHDYPQVEFREGLIEELPLRDGELKAPRHSDSEQPYARSSAGPRFARGGCDLFAHHVRPRAIACCLCS
jgi:arsenite methyltransferase